MEFGSGQNRSEPNRTDQNRSEPSLAVFSSSEDASRAAVILRRFYWAGGETGSFNPGTYAASCLTLQRLRAVPIALVTVETVSVRERKVSIWTRLSGVGVGVSISCSCEVTSCLADLWPRSGWRLNGNNSPGSGLEERSKVKYGPGLETFGKRKKLF